MEHEEAGGDPVDATTGATVCAQMQKAGLGVLGEQGAPRLPPAGVTWEEMIEYGYDQVKQ